MRADVRTFLKEYLPALEKLEIEANLASWKAATTGNKEDFDASAKASLALRKYHSDARTYARLKQLAAQVTRETPDAEIRSLRLAELAYRRNQLAPEMLEKMVQLATEIERLLTTYRADLDGKRFSNNDLLEMLGRENDSNRRQVIWESLKQVGGVIAPKLIELARIRNQAARSLGFDNFWDMSIRLQEHDPQQLLRIFTELEQLTRAPFSEMKTKMDAERAQRFGLRPEQLMPWHYDNPFFQDPPPSRAVDLDEFYRDKAKEDIVTIATKFYADIGLPIEEILKRSDLYEREGKDQHAFCTSIDRSGDVRTLCNIKPTAEWMDTMLHEQGHAVYDLHVDRSLPFNLREPSHAFTTEGIAMFFGALAKTPPWMVTYAGVKPQRAAEVAEAIRDQRRREQLIFARWTMVMLHFEKALYEDPERDLNTLWWDDVVQYQQLHRPPARHAPDWASKPHFTIAPVYYHNYMLGELFAAQLRRVLAKQLKADAKADSNTFARKDVGDYLKARVFAPGSTDAWPEFVPKASGEPLTAKYFAEEVSR